MGAGRPKGSGRFQEPTKAIRVPVSTLDDINRYLAGHHANGAKAQVKEITQPLEQSVVKLAERRSNAAKLDDTTNVTPLAPAIPEADSSLALPLFSSRVAAGIPSSAEDHIEDTIDLNQYLVDRPDSTYMLRVEGESMVDAGILANDILVVDRSLPPKHNKIVIAAINGQLTVKRLYQRGGVIKLIPENKQYPTIEISDESELVIWGVVVGSFRKF